MYGECDTYQEIPSSLAMVPINIDLTGKIYYNFYVKQVKLLIYFNIIFTFVLKACIKRTETMVIMQIKMKRLNTPWKIKEEYRSIS